MPGEEVTRALWVAFVQGRWDGEMALTAAGRGRRRWGVTNEGGVGAHRVDAILLEHSAAWRAFDAYVNSPAFLRGVIDTFGPQLLQNNPELRHASTLADPASCRHAWHAEMENREQDYYRRDRCSPFNRTADVDPRELHTIWSFQAQPCPSVGKGPHRDRENRIFSMVLFFSDADAAGWAGGEFVMLSGTDAARKRGTPFLTHRPKPNHAVLFLNRQRSIHRSIDSVGCPHPGGLLDASQRPQTPLRRLKTPPNDPQLPQEASKTPQEASKSPQEAPRPPQDV